MAAKIHYNKPRRPEMSRTKTPRAQALEHGTLQGGTATTVHLPLTQQAYLQIKHRINTLAFRPGEFLNESSIGQLLGLGRTPVHEALHLLQLEGLVDIIPRKGVMIKSDSLKDVMDLLEARLVVEPVCMGLAAERATEQQLQALADLFKQTKKASKRGDREAVMVWDTRFHEQLVEAANNVMLADAMRLLHQRGSRIWYLQVWAENDFELTLQEHEDLLSAVQRGDREAAIMAVQRHLSAIKRRILDHMKH
jgi:GntR family transcriptional regulator, rspAB operon transcriptional repressor